MSEKKPDQPDEERKPYRSWTEIKQEIEAYDSHQSVGISGDETADTIAAAAENANVVADPIKADRATESEG